MNFGERLKELRKANNLNQTELGKILGVEKSTVSMYENNNSRPDDEIKVKIANYFNVTLDYLLGRSSNPKLNRKDEIDIQKDLNNMKKQLEEGTLKMNLDGEEIDDEIKEFIINNMADTLVLAKIKAKEKFTPKKYRK